MTTKPTMPWHADGEGKCHAGCEAWDPVRRRGTGACCRVARVLPWNVCNLYLGGPCPFAVLADVLCAVRPHEEKPDDDRRCGTCANRDTLDRTCAAPGISESFGQNFGDDGPPWPNCRFWRGR